MIYAPTVQFLLIYVKTMLINTSIKQYDRVHSNLILLVFFLFTFEISYNTGFLTSPFTLL